MFKLSVFTDEISQDLEHAIKVAKEYGCEGLEVRSAWDTGIHQMSDEQVQDVKKLASDNGVIVCCLGSPFFKCELDSPKEIEEHNEFLRRLCDVAHELGTDLIRGFTFWRHGSAEGVWQQIIDQFATPIDILEKGNCRLVIENEASTYIGTGGMTAKFLDELNTDRVAGCWDPCNVVFDFDVEETPYPDGYDALKKHMIHMHLKDGERIGPKEARCTRIGDGSIDFPGQFLALLNDGYEGYASLETHWRPVDLTEEEMNRPGGASYSKDGEYASRKCFESILEMVEDAKKVVG